MKFSIIICTYNQAASLESVLECLQRQDIHGIDGELLIIDNNSKDDTRRVCEASFRRILLPCRYVFEGKQGLSVARNRGVNEARGEVLIFTDDDAKLPSSWLRAYSEAYRKYDADCVFGRISVDWACGRPRWYSDYFSAMFVALDYGSETLKINDLHHEFYGKNFSVRKSILQKLGGFDEKLGRIGGRLFLGEETRIYKRLVGEGYAVFYEPSLAVGHMLKDYEYSEAHCLKHVRDATISEYYMMSTAGGRKLFGRPVYALKKAASLVWISVCVFIESIKSSDYALRFYAKVMCGKAVQLLRLWLKKDSPDIG